jgi:hypothetical protein
MWTVALTTCTAACTAARKEAGYPPDRHERRQSKQTRRALAGRSLACEAEGATGGGLICSGAPPLSAPMPISAVAWPLGELVLGTIEVPARGHSCAVQA